MYQKLGLNLNRQHEHQGSMCHFSDSKMASKYTITFREQKCPHKIEEQLRENRAKRVRQIEGGLSLWRASSLIMAVTLGFYNAAFSSCALSPRSSDPEVAFIYSPQKSLLYRAL